MNFEDWTKTEEHRLKTKKSRNLVDIDIDEISLVSAGANRRVFYIQKEAQMPKIYDLIQDFLGEDIEKSEQPSNDEIKKALETFVDYDMPEEIKDGISTILKLVVNKKSVVQKASFDRFPSIPIPVTQEQLAKLEAEDDDDEDEE